MKIYTVRFSTAVLGVLLFVSCEHEQKEFSSENFSEEQVKARIDSLLNQKTKADTTQVAMLLNSLKDDKKEHYVNLARTYYYRLGDQKMADSINDQLTTKFPQGIQARQLAATKIYEAETTLEKEELYTTWIKNFPPEDFSNDLIIGDYVVSNIASAYAEEKKYRKAIEFTENLKEPFWESSGLYPVINIFYSTENYEGAEALMKRAIASSKVYVNTTDDNTEKARFARQVYYDLLPLYAKILSKQEKEVEALAVFEENYDRMQSVSAENSFLYAKLLLDKGQENKALEILESVVRLGQSNEEVDNLFKTLFLKNKGDSVAYIKFIKELKEIRLADLKEKLEADMVREKAPEFSLLDFDGTRVKLSDYKDKIVILDFWATWCAPCKKSFPAMQMAINKFKDDNDVVFLFIHTWERDDNPTQAAKDYITSNNYDFKVLMDLKDPKTKLNEAVSVYGVQGIPAKFVIDANGFIRFKLSGFTGGNEMAVDEMSMMVDLIKSES